MARPKTILSDQEVRSVIRLLGDVAALEGDHARKKRFLMDGLCELVAADAWVWTMGTRQKAGEPQVWAGFLHEGFSEERFTSYLKALENPKMAPIVAPFFQSVENSRNLVIYLRSELDPERRSYEPGVGEFWEAANIGHLILSSYPVDKYSMSGVGLYRNVRAPDFTPAEKKIAQVILEEVPWLHAAGWPGKEGATLPQLFPRQRIVLNLLLEGNSRREIAGRLEISENTVSGYMRDIYSHFGVNSHSELMKKFLV